tara:strand:- start:1891 stop:2331 length:441 start_codon:yes stop_codon:yes gene_type:complete
MNERLGDIDLGKLITFARKADVRQACFAGWPSDTLAHWFRWHWKHGSLYAVCDNEDIVTLGVAWKISLGDLDNHVARYWGPPREKGDCLYISDLLSTDRRGLAAAILELGKRVPNWRKLKLYARRHDKMKRMSPEAFEKLCSYKGK